MDKYAKVEKMLEDYHMTKIYIENAKKNIEFIDEDTGVKGISYDGVSGGETNKVTDIVSDTVLSNEEKKHYYKHQIKCNQREIESIDRAMEGITPLQRQIVTERYMEGKQWYVVAYNANCSESTAKRERRKAINRLILGVYGKKED